LAFVFFIVLLGPSYGEQFLQVRTQNMPYLTNAEGNELKGLKTTADEGILGDEELWAAKGTRNSSIGYWAEKGVLRLIWIQIRGFLKQ
jgi:hypothetical protein